MADTRRLGLTPQLDIEQILREAQHRWLRPAEICEILRNYHKFHIAPEPPNKPPSMQFLMNHQALGIFYFPNVVTTYVTFPHLQGIFQLALTCCILDGSLFLFDRKVLRYFRKDGHNWRKKKDGKTIKEAHEKLKVSKLI
ncbi:Calmodulin-binding transcription activator 2 [Platanthera guangdongensis]|uniref:Calmodulin-binding transcription activator 2 n=1 Tax=Platanthera guangdongensis TaxID=2320717 RepID=A0ABR2MZY4_9ASPA